MVWTEIVLTVLMGGILHFLLYRFLGGYPSIGRTQPIRILYSLIFGLVFYLLLDISVIQAVFVAVLTFIGRLIPHGNAYDLGNRHDSLGEDLALMFSIGYSRTSLMLLPIFTLDLTLMYIPVIIGILYSLSYYIGWKLPYNQKIGIINAPTAWGQIIFGLLSGLVFTTMLLILIGGIVL